MAASTFTAGEGRHVGHAESKGNLMTISLRVGFALVFSCPLAILAQAPRASEQNLNAAQARAKALVAQLTLDEKLQLVRGTGRPVRTAGYSGKVDGVPRLHIPDLIFGDGPSGVGNGALGVTAFPAPIVVASTWNRPLADAYGRAIGKEHAGKGHNVALGPTINILRVPQWGRSFETLSEDPFLTAQLGSAITEGIQSQGVIATVKHLAANNQEFDRTLVDARISERALREIYLPAFETTVKSAGALSIMCSYNKVNGDYGCENAEILHDILKSAWHFPGFVVSDWDATHSTAKQANAGLDVEMPFGPSPDYPTFFGGKLKEAVLDGRVPMSRLDDMVARVLTAMDLEGQLEASYKPQVLQYVSSTEHRVLAKDISEKGTVLLKNAGGILPFSSDSMHSIAIIGAPADKFAVFTGGGSSDVNSSSPVTPLQGIRNRAGGGIKVTYAAGTYGIAPLPDMILSEVDRDASQRGFTATYYTNATFQGEPKIRRDEAFIDLITDETRPADAEDTDRSPQGPRHNFPLRGRMWSARWTGTFTPKKTGEYRFSLSTYGIAKLYIDDRLVVQNYGKDRSTVEHALVPLKAGHAATVRVDYVADLLTRRRPTLQVGCLEPEPALLDDALQIAKKADAAVVFVTDLRTEGGDTSSLSLPGDQDNLIARVAAVNPKTIVVLNTGGPVLMPWLSSVAGVFEAWYPGQANGDAIASLLFGDTNPSARLPVSFPSTEQQTPAADPRRWPGVDDVVDYSEGLEVGYRWYDSHNQTPLFAFGYGLSYTRFALSDPKSHCDQNGCTVTINVTNTGKRAGSEVVQLYLAAPPSAGEPPRQLKAFENISLQPGMSGTVDLRVERDAARIWDTNLHSWVFVPGDYRAFIGTSSRETPFEVPISW